MKKQFDSKTEAISLRYEAGVHDAPRITAKGKGLVAEKIIEKAQENNIPIQEDPTLVELLSQLNINDRIPEELYEAVAEVFAFVYRADKAAAKN